MKHTRSLLLIAAALILPLPLAAETMSYRVAPEPDAEMKLLVYKTGLYSGKVHTFLFHEFAGELEYDTAAPQNSRIMLTIQSASLELTDDWLDEGDRPDVIKEAEEKILKVSQYPRMRFVSGEIRPLGAGLFEADGMLTITDETHPVTVTVELTGGEGGALEFNGEAVINMKDFDIDPPKVFFGIVGTKENMDFTFHVTARPIQ